MTTERLYYSDSYLSRFDATIIGQADEGRRVYLDRTAFYPSSGGQPFDTGLLGGVRVVDVVDEDDRIAHLLEHPLPPGPVEGQIDWPRRFDHMQQHSGQHLLSAVIARRLGIETVSVHFGPDSATLDLEVPAIAPEQVREVEVAANIAVTDNRPVQVGFEDAAAAQDIRKASERTGLLRIVTIAELDRSACGGTHVRATGEIGPILIRRMERVKKQVRLEFLCGMRAVTRARADFEVLRGIAGGASAGIDDLAALFSRQRSELKLADSMRRGLVEEVNGFRARLAYDAVTPDAAGRRLILHQSATGQLEALRGLAVAVAALPGAIFLCRLDSPPTILLATAPDTGLEAGAMLQSVLSTLGGRGGGQSRMAQGTVPGAPELEIAFTRVAAAASAGP